METATETLPSKSTKNGVHREEKKARKVKKKPRKLSAARLEVGRAKRKANANFGKWGAREAAPTNDFPVGYVAVGRPAKKLRDPVRTGLVQSARTLKEITNNWSAALVTQANGTHRIVSRSAAQLCADQIKFLADKLRSLTGDVATYLDRT